MNFRLLIQTKIFIFILLICSVGFTEDYYCVSTTGSKTTGVSTTDIDSFGWANVDCYNSISTALGQMSGGDQMWIDDGSYNQAIYINGTVDGSSEDYTVIRARNEFSVDITASSWPVRIADSAYIELRGIHVSNTSDQAVLVGDTDGTSPSDHIKIIRCSASQGGSYTFGCGDGSTYILWEECHAWGGPHRYAFGVGSTGGQYLIWRRCIVRWDYSDTLGPQAGFAVYSQQNAYIQNCIYIDATDNRAQNVTYDGTKGFFTPNGARYTDYDGCIVLHSESGGYFIGDNSTYGSVNIRNSVSWDLIERDTSEIAYHSQHINQQGGATLNGLDINQCVFGVSDYDSDNLLEWMSTDLGLDSLKNSIIYGNDVGSGYYSVAGSLTAYDYNTYYSNTSNRDKSILGANSYAAGNANAFDPKTNGLLYLTRIEDSSTLETAGEGGVVLGATILKRMGTSGTLYGETGWDILTSEDLWPFPNEDQIKTDCASFSKEADEAYTGSPVMTGARGFATGTSIDGSSQTLTKYIWEYLGNQIPSDIYGGPVSVSTGGGSYSKH